MRLEELGLIGNCQYSALVASNGNVVWCCMPRFDSEPIFGALLDPDAGTFAVEPADGGTGEMRYLPNSNVLETVFRTRDGAFRVIDFAPRYVLHARHYRPTKLIRIVEPIEGIPRVRIRCDPIRGWSRRRPAAEHGSNHIQYYGYPADMRLTTDVPLSYVDGVPFALNRRRHLVLAWGEPVEEPLDSLCDRMLRETVGYWNTWVKHCDIPPLYQEEVIRSSLALKLHCFDDTGAIIAAMTTSIPEASGTRRNWDYRYCWLRDAFYALSAFHKIGHFEEREQFLNFLLTVATSADGLELAPLYRVDASRDLPEVELDSWHGFEGHAPVRVGNAAVEQRQGDIYGELVLSLTPLFLDARFQHEQARPTLDLLVRLARKAVAVAGRPDAGIWEHRTVPPQAQTFSTVMSWAAAERMHRITRLHAPELAPEFDSAAHRLRDQIMRQAWNERGFLAATYGGDTVDASVLHSITLRFFQPDDPRATSTLDAVTRELGDNGWVYRYRTDDGFGRPSTAFVICSFWRIEALARLGRIDEARRALDAICQALPPLGLISEDYDPVGRRFWGNFPQAYSHVGLINAAFAASPDWHEIL